MINIDEIRKKAESWLTDEFDEPTRKEVQNLLDNDEKGLIDAFYKDLEFGTGGLRGIMGAGTNRMNRYTPLAWRHRVSLTILRNTRSIHLQ